MSKNGLLFIKGVLLELVQNLLDFGPLLQDTTVRSTTLTKVSISRIYSQHDLTGKSLSMGWEVAIYYDGLTE